LFESCRPSILNIVHELCKIKSSSEFCLTKSDIPGSDTDAQMQYSEAKIGGILYDIGGNKEFGNRNISARHC